MSGADRRRAARVLGGTALPQVIAVRAMAVVVTAVAVLAAGGAVADAAPAAAAVAPPDGAQLYREECGSCHVAYPPRALPQASWRALMSSLDRHFGTDASLDAQAAAAITAWLDRSAGRDRSSGEHEREHEHEHERHDGRGARGTGAADAQRGTDGRVVLRITETAWFRREHREIGADVWQRPAVRGPANCAACHAGAASGRFGEHDVRIPR